MEQNIVTASKPIKIPGPDHPITIERNPARIVVSVAGRIVADTREALTLREAAYPAVQYIPRTDVDMGLLDRTDRATRRLVQPATYGEMTRRFILTTWFALLAATAAAPSPAAAAAGPDEFIRNLGNQAIEVIRSGASPDQKTAYFHRALHQDFDLSSISRFVLGPHWRSASEPERQQFKALLEARLVRFYGQRFAEYNGETLRVIGSRTESEGAIVSSEIIRPQGSPIKVDWRLDTRNGVYKITDVTVDGASMALTQRSEFAGLIHRNGGQLAALLANMGERGSGSGSSTPAR